MKQMVDDNLFQMSNILFGISEIYIWVNACKIINRIIFQDQVARYIQGKSICCNKFGHYLVIDRIIRQH